MALQQKTQGEQSTGEKKQKVKNTEKSNHITTSSVCRTWKAEPVIEVRTMVQIMWMLERGGKKTINIQAILSLKGATYMNQQGSFMKKYERAFHFIPFTILYKRASVSLKTSKHEQKTGVTTFPGSQELVFYLTTIIHFISVTPYSSQGSVINYLKEPLFFLNSLSPRPEAIIALPFLVPFLTG